MGYLSKLAKTKLDLSTRPDPPPPLFTNIEHEAFPEEEWEGEVPEETDPLLTPLVESENGQNPVRQCETPQADSEQIQATIFPESCAPESIDDKGIGVISRNKLQSRQSPKSPSQTKKAVKRGRPKKSAR